MGSLTVSGIVRITRDSEVRKTSNGVWYTFGIAAFRKNAKEGKQTADFFDADLYMKDYKPEFEKRLIKGRLLYIENAYLRNDQFKGTDGKDKNRIKLMINAFELLQDKVDTDIKIPEQPKKPVDAVSKTYVAGTTHPSDLPPPMMTNKKEDINPAGRAYFDGLKKKEEEITYVADEPEEEIPF